MFKTRPHSRPVNVEYYLDTTSPCTHIHVHNVSRWASGRYRFRIRAYGVDYLSDKFRQFALSGAVAIQSFRDGTPMKLFHDGRSSNVEVYGMTVIARNSLGETQRSYPVLSHPPASGAAGILSAMPIDSLFIDELTSKPGFKLLLLNCDGANANRKAARMLMAELQPRRDLLVLVNFCSSLGLNCAAKWGIGVFSYGNLLRCCHVLQSVKNRNFPCHARKYFMGDIAGGSCSVDQQCDGLR